MRVRPELTLTEHPTLSVNSSHYSKYYTTVLSPNPSLSPSSSPSPKPSPSPKNIVTDIIPSLISALLFSELGWLDKLNRPDLRELTFESGNTKGGKYHSAVDLLFDWFVISCMTTGKFSFYLQNRLIQTSQTGGQWYSDTSPFSIPCLNAMSKNNYSL